MKKSDSDEIIHVVFRTCSQPIIMNHSELSSGSSGSNFVMDATNLIKKFWISLHHSIHMSYFSFSICDALNTRRLSSCVPRPAFLLCDVIMVKSDVMSHVTDSVTPSHSVTQPQVSCCHVTRHNTCVM